MHLSPGLSVDLHIQGIERPYHAVLAAVHDEHLVTVAGLVPNGNWSPFTSTRFVYPGETAPAVGHFVTLKGAKIERAPMSEPTPPAQPVPVAEAALETPSPVQPEVPTTRASETVESAPATAQS